MFTKEAEARQKVINRQKAIDRALANATALCCPECGGTLHRISGFGWLACLNMKCEQRPMWEERHE